MTRLAVMLLLVAACSSTSHPNASPSPTTDPKQFYVDAVNALCDDLLTKVAPYNHQGSYPVATFLAEQPKHHALLVAFDAELARIPAPAQAAAPAAAFQDYVAFADHLDAARAAAAAKGQRAFDAEVASEGFDDPSIAARDAQGFHDSCNAR